ncbi:NADH subunit 5 [Rhodopirellula maiorica SM1]|uniref:NADH subunit 5 n=1 Tax=Rhodopirellula maiorica SM1 TaxID=1265738 RepID=M5R9V0_9BACT|nr:proton-conducting transporter membrane subunit [Rhodopirellula maiorica]EMI16160.1 NADH subunit 5 [Rhodopirellula maiorica SM1]
MSPLLESSLTLQCMVITLGLVSAICGALMSRVQSDIKVSLAYASLTQVGIIVVEIGLGFRYLALIHIIGHASLRTMQLLRAPTLLRDYNELENALGARITQRQSGWTRILPAAVHRWAYRFGFDRGFMDIALDKFIVRPFLALFSVFDSLERQVTDLISNEASRESDDAPLHPEESQRVA